MSGTSEFNEDEILPIITVVIPTRNSEHVLKRCLQSVINQTYKRKCIEIIVVDNYSTDKTVSIAKTYASFVFIKGRERSEQRNFGIDKAKGEYILFLDADMLLDKRVLKNCVWFMKSDKNIVGLYIPEIILGKWLFHKIRNFERGFYNGTVIDAVRFFPKSVWRDIGGFDESLTAGEDWDFDRRLKELGKTNIIDYPLFHDETNLTWQSYAEKKASYYVDGLQGYVDKWGKDDQIVRKQLVPRYRLLEVFLKNGKWKKFLTKPHFAAGLIFLRVYIFFGVLFYYLFHARYIRPRKYDSL